jgi:hypothetical protein
MELYTPEGYVTVVCCSIKESLNGYIHLIEESQTWDKDVCESKSGCVLCTIA